MRSSSPRLRQGPDHRGLPPPTDAPTIDPISEELACRARLVMAYSCNPYGESYCNCRLTRSWSCSRRARKDEEPGADAEKHLHSR